MKRTCLILSSILSISLLMNLPAIDWMSVRGNLRSATAVAMPFFFPEAADTVGLNESGELVFFSSSDPGTILGRKPINGLRPGERMFTVHALDDENVKKIGGVSNFGGLYEIDCETGNTTLAGFFPALLPFIPPEGESIGSTIHPATGARVFSNTKAGDDVLVTSDGDAIDSIKKYLYPKGDPSFGQDPKIPALAFDNFNGEVPFRLFGIDSNQNTLVTINIDIGEIKTVGPLGVNVSDIIGFDIAPKEDESAPDKVLASFVLEGEIFSRLHTINLKTGEAVDTGIIGDGSDGFISIFGRPDPLAALFCVIDPRYSTRPAGTEHTVNVIAESFTPVRVEIVGGPNRGLVGFTNTDSKGQASFTYTSNGQTGLDIIEVEGAFSDGSPILCTGFVEWVKFIVFDTVGVTEGGDIIVWSSKEPETILDRKSINGLSNELGEKIIVISSVNVDPDNIQVIGYSNLGQIYEIDLETGNASPTGGPPFPLVDPIVPENMGFAIDPMTGERIFSNTIIGPDDLVIVDPNGFKGEAFVFYGPGDPGSGQTPRIPGLGFTKCTLPPPSPDCAGAGFSPELFGIDFNLDTLVKINRDTGEIRTIGPLGVNASPMVGFDIEVQLEDLKLKGFASIVPEGENVSRSYCIDPETGTATEIGIIGDGTEMVIDLTMFRKMPDVMCMFDFITRKQLGARHTFDVKVFVDGQPASGATVEFEIISGPNRGLTGTATTDAQGQVSFTYTGNGREGLDGLEIVCIFGLKISRNVAVVEWTDGPIINSIDDNKGKTGENIVVKGLNFQPGDVILINGTEAQKTKFKAGLGKLVAKKGERLLNECGPDGTPARNEIMVFRPAPAIIDTRAFATCP